MRCQREAHNLVRKSGRSHLHQRSIVATVLMVAVPAGKLRIVLQQRPVQQRCVGQFLRDLRVADLAAIRHSLRCPGLNMARGAIAANGIVRGKPFQDLAFASFA